MDVGGSPLPAPAPRRPLALVPPLPVPPRLRAPSSVASPRFLPTSRRCDLARNPLGQLKIKRANGSGRAREPLRRRALYTADRDRSPQASGTLSLRRCRRGPVRAGSPALPALSAPRRHRARRAPVPLPTATPCGRAVQRRRSRRPRALPGGGTHRSLASFPRRGPRDGTGWDTPRWDGSAALSSAVRGGGRGYDPDPAAARGGASLLIGCRLRRGLGRRSQQAGGGGRPLCVRWRRGRVPVPPRWGRARAVQTRRVWWERKLSVDRSDGGGGGDCSRKGEIDPV